MVSASAQSKKKQRLVNNDPEPEINNDTTRLIQQIQEHREKTKNMVQELDFMSSHHDSGK